MGNFLATVTKVSKMTGAMVPPNNTLGENTYTTTSNTIRPSTSTVSLQSTHNLDEVRNTHRQNMNGISNHPIQFPFSSVARSVNSMTSSYSWEMGPQPPRQTTERSRQLEFSVMHLTPSESPRAPNCGPCNQICHVRVCSSDG